MDPEKTAPFELGEGDPTVLLIHGFTGSPWDLRPLGVALHDRGFHVKAIRLPGHGLSADGFAGTGHRDWEQATEDALLLASENGPAFLAGLSMGALLSLRLAARFPERVGALALMAPALRFRDPKMALVRRLNRVLPLLRPHVEKNRTDIEDPYALAEAPVLPRVATKRLEDLMIVQDQAIASVPQVRAPTLVAVARHDHVVDFAVGAELVQGLRRAHEVRQVVLERGFHIMTRDTDRERLCLEVGRFFEQVRDRRDEWRSASS